MEIGRKGEGAKEIGFEFAVECSYRFSPPNALTGTLQTVWWEACFSAAGLRGLCFLRNPPRLPLPRWPADSRLQGLRARLAARLSGQAVDVAWEEFDLSGRPEFQVKVWQVLHAIPFGSVRTYAQVALAAGSPRGCRACGQACGANPILLFIPCHRVVSATGLGGFGNGLAWKKRFLELEEAKQPRFVRSVQPVESI